MIGNPYYSAATVLAGFGANARLLVSNLLDGGDWTAIFLPEHASVPHPPRRRRAPHRRRRGGGSRSTRSSSAMVALGCLVPCTYSTFLWNRVRYLWPFAGAWFVLLGCLAREVGDLARLFRPRLTAVTPLLAGAFAAAFASRLPWTLRDLAQSSSAIHRQQVALGRWASEALPADARIGVNDTGAIAYLSGRRTFDVVGLTTEGEARYWVAGAGSRFEHYEKLPAARLPTHFIVYPQWMACPPVLGPLLTEATVTDQSILGGATMEAHEARWDLLGSGALPANPPSCLELVDELDVADLESEAAHHYALVDGQEADDQVVVRVDGARTIADGGRLRRAVDRFRLKLPAGQIGRLVMRVTVDAPVDLRVSVAGREAAVVAIDDESGWVERAVDLPAVAGGGETEIEVRARERDEAQGAARFGSFHYWVYGVP